MADLGHEAVASCFGFKAVASSTGTFTQNPTTVSQARNVSKTAVAENATFNIPITLGKFINQYGVKITAFQLPYRITTANLTGAVTATFYMSLLGNANGTAVVTPVSIPCTVNASQTASANDQMCTVTITTPTYDNLGGTVTVGSGELQVVFPTAAGTILSVYDAFPIFNAVDGQL